MSDAVILHYFSQPRTGKVCGRFRSEQLWNPEEKAIEPIKNSVSNPTVPNFQSQPTKQLLHFAYLLVLVLGVGISACGESAVTGQVQGKAITVDSSDHTSPEKSNRENVNPKREVVELMGDTVASIEVEEKPMINKDTCTVVKPQVEPRPTSPRFIKGKVKLPKNPIPEVQKPVEEKQDIHIMGECVMPYGYDDTQD
jgi:hypothetical protein